MTKKAMIGEVKLNSSKISIAKLRAKAQRVEKELKEYTIDYRGYSMDDLTTV